MNWAISEMTCRLERSEIRRTHDLSEDVNGPAIWMLSVVVVVELIKFGYIVVVDPCLKCQYALTNRNIQVPSTNARLLTLFLHF